LVAAIARVLCARGVCNVAAALLPSPFAARRTARRRRPHRHCARHRV